MKEYQEKQEKSDETPIEEREKKIRKKRNGKDSESYKYLSEKVGMLLRSRRIELGLSQTELADAVDITVSFLSDIEHYRTMPSIDTFVRLCAILKMPPLLPTLPDPKK